MSRRVFNDSINRNGGDYYEPSTDFMYSQSSQKDSASSLGFEIITPRRRQQIRTSLTPAQDPTQAYAPAPATWTAQAQTSLVNPSALTPALAPTSTSTLVYPVSTQISNVAYSTSSKLEEIYDLKGTIYQWQSRGLGNYNFLSDHGNPIYSAMHFSNIAGASNVNDKTQIYVNFQYENGESRAFKGLRLGDFVYFNFTNQDIFVGGGTGFPLPTNNIYTLGHPAVQADYEAHQPIGSVSVITDETYQKRLLFAQQQNELLRIQNKQDIDSRDDAIDRAKSLQQINEQLKIAPQRQLESIKKLEQELLIARREIKRLRQNEYDRDESERLARNAASKKAFNESEIESSLFRARQEAQAAKDLAAAETARAARAAKDLAAALRKQLDEQAAAKDLAAAELKKAQADAAEAATAAELKKAQAEAEIAELKKALADERVQAAAKAPQNELADTTPDWTEWAELDKRNQSQEIGVQTDDILSQLEKDLAVAAAARAAAALRLQQKRADDAEEEIAILKGSISSFRVSLENIKTQFEKLKNLFGSEDIKTKPKPNIEYKQGDRQNNFKLKWIINLDELKKKTTGYNIFLKFTAFSDDHQSEEEQQQKALSQVALLKLKLIELGKDKHSSLFLSQKETINAYLSEVSKLMAVNNFDLNDKETKEFCEEYFLLGQQYKKILEKEKNKPDSNIKKMMSYEFKKDKICYDNESAREYLGFNEDRFEAEFTLVSSNAFNSIIEAHSDSSDKTKANAKAKAKDDANDDAKKNDDKIILLNSFILSLEQACKGHEEIVKDSSDQIEISPEVAKVFVALDNFEAGKLWNSLSCEKQIQLKVFLKQELQYSQVEQEGVVGRSKIDINKYVDKRKEGESSWMFSKIFDTLITKQEKKEIKKKFDAPTKEVSDFFEKRKLRCEELLDYKVKDKLEDLPLSRQDGVNSAVEKKNDVFSNFLDLLNQVIIKFNEDFKQILRGEEEETSPVTVQAAARREGEGEEAGGVGDGRRNPAPAPAPAHAAAAPGPVAGRGGGGGD